MARSETVFTPKSTRSATLASRTLKRVGEMLQVEIHNPVDIVRLTRSGFPVMIVDRVVSAGVAEKDLWGIIPRSTLIRRKKKHEALTPEESDKLVRFAKVQALATEVLGSEEKASKWLHKPRRVFDGMSAIDLMQSEAGAQLVEETLGQLDAGYFA